MSHTVKVVPNLQDIQLVCQAFEKLGWHIALNATVNGVYDVQYNPRVCAFVAKNPQQGYYDVGLVRSKEGIEFVYDGDMDRDPRFQKTFGQQFGLLKQEYVRLAVLEKVDQAGGVCNISADAYGMLKGEIEIEMLL
jgi:hypothetical protein